MPDAAVTITAIATATSAVAGAVAAVCTLMHRGRSQPPPPGHLAWDGTTPPAPPPLPNQSTAPAESWYGERVPRTNRWQRPPAPRPAPPRPLADVRSAAPNAWWRSVDAAGIDGGVAP